MVHAAAQLSPPLPAYQPSLFGVTVVVVVLTVVIVVVGVAVVVAVGVGVGVGVVVVLGVVDPSSVRMGV